VPRLLLVPLAVLCLTLTGCGDDERATPTDPTNAFAELGRDIDLGYDRTDWDPTAVEAAREVAERAGATTIGCINPTVTSFDVVKTQMNEPPRLPMPGAVVQCSAISVEEGDDGEDLTIEAFVDEEAKNVFIEAKAELLCERLRILALDFATGVSFSEGVAYVDLGTVIIEPDSWQVRDELARQMGGVATNMCPDVTADRPAATTPGT